MTSPTTYRVYAGQINKALEPKGRALNYHEREAIRNLRHALDEATSLIIGRLDAYERDALRAIAAAGPVSALGENLIVRQGLAVRTGDQLAPTTIGWHVVTRLQDAAG